LNDREFRGVKDTHLTLPSVHHSLRYSTIIAAALGMVYALMIAAPALVITRFHLDRAEIIRTLCVERMMPVEKNCCKGSCQLTKRLEATRAESNGQEAPPRLELVEVIAIVDGAAQGVPNSASARSFPILRGALQDGVNTVPDPVPWSA
jgi:hypothetical protein